MPEVLIYAHRGGMANAPENTAAAMRRASLDGASAVECDIRRTADGEFVAFHDASTGRLCGRDWKISETAWAHLKSLRVLGQEPIAHLDDILNLAILRPGLEFYLELALEKEADAAELALRVRRAGVQSRFYMLVFSHKARLLKAARQAVPGIGSAVMPLFPSGLLETAREAGASKVCAGWVGLPLAREIFYLGAAACGFKEQANEAEAAGVEVSAGIANHPRDIRRLAELGARAVWTDDVPLAARYL